MSSSRNRSSAVSLTLVAGLFWLSFFIGVRVAVWDSLKAGDAVTAAIFAALFSAVLISYVIFCVSTFDA